MKPAASIIRTWRENPSKFVWDNFKVTPDAWQEDALNAFASTKPEHQRIAMKACAGPGKSAVLAWCGWNFLACYGDEQEHPKGACVSVTATNLADNLWPEFSKWQARSEFLTKKFEWTKSRISCRDHKETWFLAARSFSKKANTEEQGRTLSGLHSKFVLALLDESGDIPPAVVKAAEQALSTGPRFGKILQAGNPTSHDGVLYAAAERLRHLWYVITITGDPDDPKRSPRIDIDWAREQIKTYGVDDPWIMAFILGKFPKGSVNSLLSVEEVEAAMARHYRIEQYGHSQKRMGIDVAAEGDDRTVIFPRQGLVAFNPVVMRTQRGPDIAARVIQGKVKWGSEMEFFDDTGGWGKSAIDSYMMAGHNPTAINFAGKAIDPRYLNKRAEIWFEMAGAIRRGQALPNLPDLIPELTVPKYFLKNGKFQIEPKELIKKRLKRSPDLADALALTYAYPDMPAADSVQGLLQNAKAGKAETDFDPLDDSRYSTL
jgi:phage terminase large subunit